MLRTHYASSARTRRLSFTICGLVMFPNRADVFRWLAGTYAVLCPLRKLELLDLTRLLVGMIRESWRRIGRLATRMPVSNFTATELKSNEGVHFWASDSRGFEQRTDK
jgi:hypothetical protein